MCPLPTLKLLAPGRGRRGPWIARPLSELGSRAGENYGGLTGNIRVSAALSLPHPSLCLDWEAPGEGNFSECVAHSCLLCLTG